MPDVYVLVCACGDTHAEIQDTWDQVIAVCVSCGRVTAAVITHPPTSTAVVAYPVTAGTWRPRKDDEDDE